MFEEDLIAVKKKELADAMRLAGYTKFEIEVRGSKGYGDCKVFEDLNDDSFGKGDGWPLVWRVCEKVGVSWGAGNHRNHQINLLQPFKRG